MQLPVDIPAVLKAATDLEGAAQTPVSVSVYIDDSAPDDVIAHGRAAFASAGPNARVTIGYLGEAPVTPYEQDDMAVIIAGVAENVGAQAAHLRDGGIPVMVVTVDAEGVAARALAEGHPIPEADIVSPAVPERKLPTFVMRGARKLGFAAEETTYVSAQVDGASEGFAPEEGAAEEVALAIAVPSPAPARLSAEDAQALDTRMGEWIISACADKKLAFALAFRFVRRPLSIDAINATSLQNAGIGLVPLIPGADMPIMTLNQIKMLFQIATAYGEPMDMARAKEVAAVVAGAFLFRNIARSAAGLVPVVGGVIRAGVGYAGTEAMGRAAIEYFEAGGDMVGFASVLQTARDEATDAVKRASATPLGQKVIARGKGLAKDALFSRKKS